MSKHSLTNTQALEGQLRRGLVAMNGVQRMAARCDRRSEKESIDDTLEQLHRLSGK